MSSKGKKVFQIAKELLVSHQEIIAFLQKSGYKSIKTHMSAIDDEMLEKILARFSKEKKHAESYLKQKQKDQETEEPQVAEGEEPAVEEAPVAEAVSAVVEEPVVVEDVKAEKTIVEDHTGKAAVAMRGTDFHTDDLEKKEAPGEKKKVDLLESLKSSQKSIEEFKQAFEKARLQLERQALKDQEGRRGRRKKEGEEEEPQPAAAVAAKGKKKKKKKAKVDDRDVEAAIRETLAKMEETGTQGEERQKRKRRRREERESHEVEDGEDNILEVQEFISVHELADLMEVEPSEVIKTCMSLGLIVSINQRLEMDTITLVASEFGFQVEKSEQFHSEELEEEVAEIESAEAVSRPPIVTIMGHVDHGKTSLLDYIRRANVVAGEAGGITQHIGAYEVELSDGRHITFLDTPGHEAFTAMRARGAQVTDIVVIVVAADDNVMPQTVEAINHAQAASVPIIIAINKIDKPDANPMRIKTQLSEKNILVEEWGGKYQCVEISSKSGQNIPLLLEKILLEAEVMELKAPVATRARGTVIEARLDKGRGATATVLVEAGTLRVGDPFICGIYAGRVKAMFDERGNTLEQVGPATPVQLIGFDGVPQAGDQMVVTKNEKTARDLATKRQQLKREQDHRRVHHLTLDEISKQVREGKIETLPIVLKGDVDGSVEALSDSIMRIPSQEVKVEIIHRGVGAITESDVLLASASGAIVIGFHVRPNLNARKIAEREEVDIRYYNIIYDCIEDIRKALEGLLEPEFADKTTGTVEVREIFKISKIGTVAGCYVADGKINRTQPIRLLRSGEVVHEGKLASLKRFKDDAREVSAGMECGVTIDNYNDIKVGDVIECYERIETKRTLTV
jgi:translation initiation factor IF-2